MYSRHRSQVQLEHPMVMIANAHLRQLERDIEEIHLAALLRAGRPRANAPLAALVRRLCARLARAGGTPAHAQPPMRAAEPVDGA